jgi:exosortase/archaeosortase family protein
MVRILSYFQSLRENLKKNRGVLIRFLPLFAFIPPLLILYYLDPASFQQTLEGRTFYLFFVWLISLETILNWERIEEFKAGKATPIRATVFIAALILPTACIIAGSYYGLLYITPTAGITPPKTAIVNLATYVANYFGLKNDNLWMVPLSTEYLVLTVLFAFIISVGFGISRLKDFALSTLFLGAIGSIYTINNFYPYGLFTPFQIPVPITTQLAAGVLNLMGYSTSISPPNNLNSWTSLLSVANPKKPFIPYFNPVTFGVAWPCAGVESLIIYTIVVLVFLKVSGVSWKLGAVYFALGAIVTYFINVLRIVTIFTIAMQYGQNSQEVTQFHNYYGQLYSITWITLYPLIIMGSQLLWNKVKIGMAQRRSLRSIRDLPPVIT